MLRLTGAGHTDKSTRCPPVYEFRVLVSSLIQLLDSLAKVINERLQSHMKMITLMLSAVIIYPCHQFFRAFSFRHVGPLRR